MGRRWSAKRPGQRRHHPSAPICSPAKDLSYHPIADTAFGYVRRDATPAERADGAPRRVLDVDEAAAPLIREAYERIASGQAIRSVANWLAGLPSEERGHRAWSPSAVRGLL